LVHEGLVALPQGAQPKIASYDAALLAPNPQRGRVVDRDLDELARSLDTHSQQEPIVCRLITDTDRKRWPDAFTERQILLVLRGHRIYFASQRSKLRMLRVELLLPASQESDLDYSRRGLRRASIKMMHSQGYTIFDKVNLFDIWRQEFAIEKPKDKEIAAFFEISRSEAQRLKTVAQLDEKVAQDIINSEKPPADEIVYLIASHPVHGHEEAYERLGHLTVQGARKLLKEQKRKADTKVKGAGRPRNYVVPVTDEESNIAYVATGLTKDQWRKRGGSRAFWDAINSFTGSMEVRARLAKDLDE